MADDRWLYAWALGSIALGGGSLLFPLYVVELGADAFALGILGASAAFLGAPGAFLVGRIADRSGRRRPFVVGALIAVALVLAVVPFTDSVPVVVVGNAVVWFAAAAAGPVLTLLVTVGKPEQRWQDRIARLNTFQGWGWAGGLVLGIAWTGAGSRLFDPLVVQRTFFGAIAVCGAVAALLAARTLPSEGGTVGGVRRERLEGAVATARRPNVRGATFQFTPSRLFWLTRSLSPRRLIARFTPALSTYFLAVTLFFAGFSVFFAPLPAFLTDVGYGDGLIFALYLVSSLGSAAFYARVGELAGRYDLTVLQTGGLVVRTVAFPLVALLGTGLATSAVGVALTGLDFLCIGLAWAIIAVTAATLVSRLSPAAIRGEMLGVYTAVSTLAGGIGSFVGGLLATTGDFTLAFGTAGALVLAGAGLVLIVRLLARPATATASVGRPDN